MVAGASELLFTLLPLLVLAIVQRYLGKTAFDLFATPEWAFAAAILFGQSLVAIVERGGSPAGAEASADAQRAFWAALLIVGGLAPSLIVLALVLSTAARDVAPWLLAAQVSLFVGAAIVFLRVRAYTGGGSPAR